MEGLRRSRRHAAIYYDSNGRDFIADQLSLTRMELETWLTLPTVHPHLLMWYNLCVLGRKRFKEARGWIETGDEGYYYNSSELEEDLLLMCMGTGNLEDGTDGFRFADEKASTFSWTTQAIWARSAWRIVQDNRGRGQVFEKKSIHHAASAYGTTIDVLTIAFHSIAFRGGDSVWHQLILNGCQSIKYADIELDQDPEGSDQEENSEDDSAADSDVTMLDSDDDFEEPKTPMKSSKSAQPPTPGAPKKLASYRLIADFPSSAASDEEEGDNIAVAHRKDNDAPLRLIDENGDLITGYRMAS